ncbi:TetR/AcrR family transcriptional regulator [Actinomyces capricornis]|uniref:HTH tetR-type domain-containing protein n=1 Tax=Actinomyces capricornis TaxID=2755559 RepID=A0ABN6K3V8_9ACTO|nr:TetR/AcrR family transcriptional regulator [Actinomyces capricornis]BDA64253.1 hypothetical protein MANAM107_10870 [Actinomyces capricornis]
MSTPSSTPGRTADSSRAATDGRTADPERSLRKRENTRARLVEVAADVVAARGIAGTRIDDVVKEAGFTRGAFYSNYSSLQEVLNEAIAARTETILRTVDKAVEAIEGMPTTESLMDLLDSIAQSEVQAAREMESVGSGPGRMAGPPHRIWSKPACTASSRPSSWA